MNRRDDWSEICLHTVFSDRAEYLGLFPKEENTVCKQRSSKGASVFMESPGSESLFRRIVDRRNTNPRETESSGNVHCGHDMLVTSVRVGADGQG